jgi:serine O-acetyltransferase
MLAIHAVAHWLCKHKIPVIPRVLSVLNRLIFATQLPASTRLGKGVRLNYSGLGTVIHARAVIGNNVEIGPGVVIGGRSKLYEVPIIEDDVQIGVGAKILGPLRVGRGAVIGANAVVLHDVPAGAVMVGIPARVLRIEGPPLQETGTGP